MSTGSSIKVRPALDSIQRDLDEVVRYLAAVNGVTRVWLFGSAAKGRDMDWRSDLDIAVEGLPGALWERAWSELDARLAWPLDLVRWEAASPALREQVLLWGKVIYEAH